MKASLLIAPLVALLVLALGPPASASPQLAHPKAMGALPLLSAQSYIDVTQCQVGWYNGSFPWTDPFGALHLVLNPPPKTDAFLHVTFSNTSIEPTTVVVFGLVSNGTVVALARDRATAQGMSAFAKGVAISSQNAMTGTLPRDGASYSCLVLKVEHANGATYLYPNPPF